MEFAEILKRVVYEYNNRRKNEAYVNEVFDDIADQLASISEELKNEKNHLRKWVLIMRKNVL